MNISDHRLQENLRRGILVDPEDEHLLRKHIWHINTGGYAQRGAWRKMVLLHQEIVAFAQVNHINRNKKDNRKANLRDTCRAEQQRGKSKGLYAGIKPSSKFKGVSWDKAYEKWRARITFENKLKHLGYFDDEREAALAYDRAALELFGEFAATNADLGLL